VGLSFLRVLTPAIQAATTNTALPESTEKKNEHMGMAELSPGFKSAHFYFLSKNERTSPGASPEPLLISGSVTVRLEQY
jgi:hypothetical protein